MKTFVCTALAATFAASTAFAGGFSATIEEPDLVVVEPNTSSASQIIVPLIFLGLVAVAMSADDGDDTPDTTVVRQ